MKTISPTNCPELTTPSTKPRRPKPVERRVNTMVLTDDIRQSPQWQAMWRRIAADVLRRREQGGA